MHILGRYFLKYSTRKFFTCLLCRKQTRNKFLFLFRFIVSNATFVQKSIGTVWIFFPASITHNVDSVNFCSVAISRSYLAVSYFGHSNSRCRMVSAFVSWQVHDGFSLHLKRFKYTPTGHHLRQQRRQRYLFNYSVSHCHLRQKQFCDCSRICALIPLIPGCDGFASYFIVGVRDRAPVIFCCSFFL